MKRRALFRLIPAGIAAALLPKALLGDPEAPCGLEAWSDGEPVTFPFDTSLLDGALKQLYPPQAVRALTYRTHTIFARVPIVFDHPGRNAQVWLAAAPDPTPVNAPEPPAPGLLARIVGGHRPR